MGPHLGEVDVREHFFAFGEDIFAKMKAAADGT
jgi:hypothetical protein